MKTLTAVLAVALAASTASAERGRLELMNDGAAKSNAGDHAGAIAAYEQAYVLDLDPALLTIIASEYRKAGDSGEAMRLYCEYLAAQPKGPNAPFATLQVLAIRRELGMPATKGVCDKASPIRIDFVTPRRAPRAKPGMSKREVAGVATAVVGLASLGASLYYHSRASDISDQIANHPANAPWPSDIQELEDRGQRFEDRGTFFMIAGGAALVTAGALYFTGRANRLSESTVIAPAVTSTGGGISLTRGF